MRQHERICLAASAALWGLLMTSPAAQAAWNVKEEVREGLPWVINPDAPKEGTREIRLRELWRIGGDDPDVLFGVVSAVFQDDNNNICLLDSQLSELRIYSPDGELVRTMGRAGEGPGEFLQGFSGCPLPGGGYAVIQNFPGKVVKFNSDGTPGGTMMPILSDDPSAQSFLIGFDIKPIGGNLGIVCMNQQFIQGLMHRTHMVGMFDVDGKLLTRLVGFEDDVDMSQGIPISENSGGSYRDRWIATPGGTIYAVPSYYGYEIRVFDAKGAPQQVITREYEHLPRTAEEKAMWEEFYIAVAASIPNARPEVEAGHRDISGLYIGPDGLLWSQSSRGQMRVPEGVVGIYDVFDKNGHYVRQVSLLGPGDPVKDGVFLLGDRLVVVTGLLSSAMSSMGGGASFGEDEGEEEDLAVICYAL